MKKKLILATLATLLTGLLTGSFRPAEDGSLPANIGSPVLAAELARDDQEVDAVYGKSARQITGGEERWSRFDRELTTNTYADIAFILCYGALFFLAGRAMRSAAGFAVQSIAVVAVVCDLLENLGILRQLAAGVAIRPPWQTSVPSLVKWSALALIWILLIRWFKPLRFTNGWEVTRSAAALFYLAAGLLCLAAVGFSSPDWIERALPLSSLAILVQLNILIFDDEFGNRLL